MIRDLLSRYSTSYPMEDYTYVGFGSKFFTDFLLFHKYLHIDKLISIEGDKGNQKKYDFNKPLKCIDIKYGMSTEVLPTLSLEKNKTIVWLDYDGLLNEDCLADVAGLADRLEDGSVLLITYNSRPLKSAELRKQYPEIESEKERLKQYITDTHGSNYLPHNLELRGLHKWNDYSALLRQLVVNSLEKRLAVKAMGETSTKTRFKQVVNFNYQDGCEMSTLGFVFYSDEKELEKIEGSKISLFDFYKDGVEPYKIEVPNLTMKEIKALLEVMPKSTTRLKEMEAIVPPSEIEQFSKIYKYLPLFTDSEVF